MPKICTSNKFFLILISAILAQTTQLRTCIFLLYDEYQNREDIREREIARMRLEREQKFSKALITQNIKDVMTNTEIHEIIRKGFPALIVEIVSQENAIAEWLIKLILEQKNKYRDQELSYTNKEGLNPFHLILRNEISCEINSLVKLGKEAILLRRISHGTKTEWQKFLGLLFGTQDHSGNTPLHYALLRNTVTLELIQEIINYYPAACSLANNEGNTPVHLAAIKPEILNSFLQLAYFSETHPIS